MLRLQRVDSMSIDYIAYDDASRNLFVRFRDSGDLYAYHNVPPAVYVGLVASDSHEPYLNYEVKGTFDYTMVQRGRRRAPSGP
jgi:hypothetical protein